MTNPACLVYLLLAAPAGKSTKKATLPNMDVTQGYQAASSGGKPYKVVQHKVRVSKGKLTTVATNKPYARSGAHTVTLDLKTGRFEVTPPPTMRGMFRQASMANNLSLPLQLLTWMEEDINACLEDKDTLPLDIAKLRKALAYVRSKNAALEKKCKPLQACNFRILPEMDVKYAYTAASSGGKTYTLVQNSVLVRNNKLTTTTIGRAVGRTVTLDLATGQFKIDPPYSESLSKVKNVPHVPQYLDLASNPHLSLQVLGWMENDIIACQSAQGLTATDRTNLHSALQYVRSLGSI